MKKCSRCKQEKLDKEFNYKNKASDIRHISCKECTRQQVRNHYTKNKDYYLIKARKRNKETKDIVKKYIWNYLIAHPCIDCGEKDPIVLDFDHKRDKIAPISHIIKINRPLRTIKKEIEKCEVRCANCHRRKTARDFKWYKHKYASVA